MGFIEVYRGNQVNEEAAVHQKHKAVCLYYMHARGIVCKFTQLSTMNLTSHPDCYTGDNWSSYSVL